MFSRDFWIRCQSWNIKACHSSNCLQSVRRKTTLYTVKASHTFNIKIDPKLVKVHLDDIISKYSHGLLEVDSILTSHGSVLGLALDVDNLVLW